jgi:hypothetical protein
MPCILLAMFYVALATDRAGTQARYFEGGPPLHGIDGALLQLKILGTSENREAAQAAAEDLQAPPRGADTTPAPPALPPSRGPKS